MPLSSSDKKPRVVVIGGGTGIFTALSGLKKYPLDLAAVVSMADDGGSTGTLREEFGILPPGDIRRTLVALAHSDRRLLSALFNYRFEKGGGLAGHAFGNIMLAALERLTGSFEEAVSEAGRILGVCGAVIPVTLDNVRLCAELEDGSIIHGETNIDIPRHDARLKIKRVFLEPQARINKRARQAITAADMIVIGPGDLYTSLAPNLIARGMAQAIRQSRAKKVYVVNIMTKWGETNGFAAKDFISEIEKYLKPHKDSISVTGIEQSLLDYAIINTKHPSPARLKHYEKESAEFVSSLDLPQRPLSLLGDFLRPSGFIRHDPDKLAKALVSLL